MVENPSADEALHPSVQSSTMPSADGSSIQGDTHPAPGLAATARLTPRPSHSTNASVSLVELILVPRDQTALARLSVRVTGALAFRFGLRRASQRREGLEVALQEQPSETTAGVDIRRRLASRNPLRHETDSRET